MKTTLTPSQEQDLQNFIMNENVLDAICPKTLDELKSFKIEDQDDLKRCELLYLLILGDSNILDFKDYLLGFKEELRLIKSLNKKIPELKSIK